MVSRQAFGLGLAVLAATSIPNGAQAQRVAADIHIGGWPIAGTIRIGERPYYSRGYGHYPRPRRRIADYGYPRQIVVDRRHGWNWKKHRDARLVVVYFDRQCGLYFDRYHHGLQEVRVLRDDDQYYWYDDYDSRDDDRFLYDRRGNDRDRYDSDRRGQDERSRDDRRGGRDDDDDDDNGRWQHDH